MFECDSHFHMYRTSLEKIDTKLIVLFEFYSSAESVLPVRAFLLWPSPTRSNFFRLSVSHQSQTRQNGKVEIILFLR